MKHAARPAPNPDKQRIQPVRARLQKIAYWLDECIPIPGTRWKVGVEPIIGLVPVAGDVIGFLLSGFIIIEAVRIGAPPRLLARMIGITVVDVLSGLLPVVGDLFDFAFKANRRNAELLSRHLDALEGKQAGGSRWRQLFYLVLLAVIAGMLLWGLYRLLQAMLA